MEWLRLTVGQCKGTGEEGGLGYVGGALKETDKMMCTRLSKKSFGLDMHKSHVLTWLLYSQVL